MNILKNYISTDTLELLTLVFAATTLAFIILSIIFIVKYLKAKKEYNSSLHLNAKYLVMNNNLSADKEHLEKSLKGMETKLNESIKKFEESDLTNKALNKELEDLKLKVKRSETAKKAAETRKKNKESQKTIEKLVDKE